MRTTVSPATDRIADLVRPVLVALVLFAAALLTLGRAQAQSTQAGSAPAAITLTDLAGHTVALQGPAHRLLIDDGRFLTALSLLHKDPVAVLAAWPRDINRFGERAYADYEARFPAIDRLARVASSAGKLSVEQVLAARPDLAVFSLGSQPSDADRATMEAAGIKVMVIDFFIHPLANTEPSLLLLGRATGAEEAAQRFIAYRRTTLEAIRTRIAASSNPAPKVFLEPHAAQTNDCCNSPGSGNVGDLIAFAGGANIGAAVIPRAFGKLNLEYVIAQDPDVYIATGGAHMAGTAGLTVGPEFSPDVARRTLKGVVARPGFAALKAVREGRVHGLSHQLLNSPLDLVTAQILAAWIRPDLFTEAEADAVQRTLNDRFLAVPVAGPNWIDLD